MAAWIVVAYVAGMVTGTVGAYLAVREEMKNLRRWAAQAPNAAPADRPLLSDEMTVELVRRLMDVSLPQQHGQIAAGEDPVVSSHQPEYEPPMPEVGDWTDPFIGHERPDFMGVGAGAGVPGMDTPDLSPEEWQARGEAAFAGWEGETQREMIHEAPGTSWVERIELSDE